MFACRRSDGGPFDSDGLIAAELLIIKPEFETYVCWTDDDADRVFNPQVVLLEGPEVRILGDELLLIGGGKIGADFA